MKDSLAAINPDIKSQATSLIFNLYMLTCLKCNVCDIPLISPSGLRQHSLGNHKLASRQCRVQGNRISVYFECVMCVELL